MADASQADAGRGGGGGADDVLTMLAPERVSFLGLGLLLVVIAAVYVLFAIDDGRPGAMRTEWLGAAAFIAVAAVAVWNSSPLMLGLGYLAHSGWDALHHPRAIDTGLKRWYPPFCLAYDAPVGVFILLWFS